jgi:L-lysine 2,3-aminomutase
MKNCGIGGDFCAGPSETIAAYLSSNPEVSDVILTGGDPLIMSAEVLKRYVDPLLAVDSLNNVRISTRSLTWWPYRFTNEEDSDELLRFFEKIVETGRSLTIMAHVCHARELSTAVVENAIRRIRSTGAVIRCQSPMLNHVNANAQALVDLWSKEVSLGLIPYYLFGEDGAGPDTYFKLPLVDVLDIFQQAQSQTTGLARTVRGPVYNYGNNKVLLDGVSEIGGERIFVLKYVQAHQQENTGRIFFAKYDNAATRFSELRLINGRP